MFWYNFLFVAVAVVVVLYLIKWAQLKKRDENYISYILALIIGGLCAYFIKERVVQVILLIGLTLATHWVTTGLTKLSNK